MMACWDRSIEQFVHIVDWGSSGHHRIWWIGIHVNAAMVLSFSLLYMAVATLLTGVVQRVRVVEALLKNVKWE